MAAINSTAVRMLTKNLVDEDLAAVAAALAGICDSAAPPYRIVFGSNTQGVLPGSSIDTASRVIFLATEDERGNRRSPAAIVVSLAHEVGHVNDPPTMADQALDPLSVAYRRRTLERETTAWAWAAEFLAASRAWPNLKDVCAAAKEDALARYRVAMRQP